MRCVKVEESDRLTLVPLNLNFLSQNYVNWINDEEVNKHLETRGNYTLQKLKEYLEDVEKKIFCFGQFV